MNLETDYTGLWNDLKKNLASAIREGILVKEDYLIFVREMERMLNYEELPMHISGLTQNDYRCVTDKAKYLVWEYVLDRKGRSDLLPN